MVQLMFGSSWVSPSPLTATWLRKSWLRWTEIVLLTQVYQSFSVVICGVVETVSANNFRVRCMAIYTNSVPKNEVNVVPLYFVKMIFKGCIEVVFSWRWCTFSRSIYNGDAQLRIPMKCCIEYPLSDDFHPLQTLPRSKFQLIPVELVSFETQFNWSNNFRHGIWNKSSWIQLNWSNWGGNSTGSDEKWTLPTGMGTQLGTPLMYQLAPSWVPTPVGPVQLYLIQLECSKFRDGNYLTSWTVFSTGSWEWNQFNWNQLEVRISSSTGF